MANAILRAAASPAGLALGVLGLFGGMLASFWTGFLASDDALYWAAAGKLLTQFPYVGDSHWALRQTLVVPMAIARALMGDTPLALVLPTLIYSGALLVMLALWLRTHAGVLAAAVAVALVATNPQIVSWSSTADIDPAKLFFVFAALILYLRGIRPGAGLAPLAGAGVLAGLGYLTHETTMFATAAIGVLFLAGYGMPRGRYMMMAAGFVPVVLSEFLFLGLMTGDPLHRHRPTMGLTHDVTISRWVDQGATVPIIHPLIDPVTMLLLNQNFGLLAWIGVPLAVWLLASRRLSGERLRIAQVMMVVAVVWTLLSAGLWQLLPLTPRYFLVPAVLVSVVAGIAISELARGGRARLAALLVAAMLLANSVAVALSNRDLMFGEETLAELATLTSGVIHTDASTRTRAHVLLGWEGVADRVTAAAPQPGQLFYFNPVRLPPGSAVDPGWEVVQQYQPPARPVVSAILKLLPASMVPQKILRKFTIRHPGAVLYRVR
jgi:4-amino-4-deoxy-L-arabinose transferase-like glycosyltransferase